MIDKSKVDILMSRFECGRATVYNALAYKTNSELAENIRQEALNRYGGVQNNFRLPSSGRTRV